MSKETVHWHRRNSVIYTLQEARRTLEKLRNEAQTLEKVLEALEQTLLKTEEAKKVATLQAGTKRPLPKRIVKLVDKAIAFLQKTEQEIRAVPVTREEKALAKVKRSK